MVRRLANSCDWKTPTANTKQSGPFPVCSLWGALPAKKNNTLAPIDKSGQRAPTYKKLGGER
jgi:hypothetical protein